MELYSDVVDDFVKYLVELSPRERSAVAEFNGERISIDRVLKHVIDAGYWYAEYIKHALRRTKPTNDLTLDIPRDPIDAIRSLIPRTAEVLEGFWDSTEKQLAGMIIETSWKQAFSVDQMFEHAIVHISWHKRQCQRIIARSTQA